MTALVLDGVATATAIKNELRVRIEALRAELATLKLDAEDLVEARLEARSEARS